MIWMAMALMAIEDEDDSAFIRKVFMENEQTMFRTALKILKDEHTARDIVSAACIRMMEKISYLRKIDSCKLTPYVITIVRNTSFMYLRKKRRENTWLVDDENVFDWIPHEQHEVGEEMIVEAEMDELRGALNRIHRSHRELLEMKYFENLK